jgi:hypothetical protein
MQTKETNAQTNVTEKTLPEGKVNRAEMVLDLPVKLRDELTSPTEEVIFESEK